MSDEPLARERVGKKVAHGVPVLGIPEAANWREDRDARHVDGAM
jgi:hypothetical protein